MVASWLPFFEVKKMKDLVLGLILLVLSIATIVLSSSFPDFVVRGERLPGPKFFPTILSIILICFAIYFVIVGSTKLIKKTAEFFRIQE
ncbi:MAG TPA: hypothetical protein VIL29_06210 [Pseudothermotoga sp.]